MPKFMMNEQMLPFRIGQEYEELEFDLDVVENELLPNYDEYKYLKKVNVFMNYFSDETELYFLFDVLKIVKITLFNIGKKEMVGIIKLLQDSYQGVISISNYELHYCVSRNCEFYLLQKGSGCLLLIYGDFTSLEAKYLHLLLKN